MDGTRRDLIRQFAGATVGLAYTACGATHAFGQEPRRRQVVINGKRVRTVDMHAHCHIPEATGLAGYKQTTPALVIGPDRIKAMDEQGIDIEALSINPNFWDKAEHDLQAPDRQVAERKARRGLRKGTRALCRARLGRDGPSRSRGRAA